MRRSLCLCLNIWMVNITSNRAEVITHVQVKWLTQVYHISWTWWQHGCRSVKEALDLPGLHRTCSWLFCYGYSHKADPSWEEPLEEPLPEA